MKKILFTAMALMTILPACKKQTVETATPAQQLIGRMSELSQKGIMYAHQDDPFYGLTWQWERDRSDTYELVGDYPGVMGFDLGGIEKGDDKNLDSVPFSWIREEAIRHAERGGIITFSWHPRNPRTGGNAWDTSDSTVVRNILEGGEQHDLFMGWLQAVGTFLQGVTTEDGTPIAFIFRPWHEYNGSWFWWGQALCSQDEYKALWALTQATLNEMLPGSIVWSCSPNLQGNWTEEEFLSRWPGNDNIDILGEDCYQWGTEEDFVAGTTADVAFLSNYAHNNGLLFAITECGMQNSPVADWWSRVLFPIIENSGACYFLPWRNWSAEHFGASKDATTAADFAELAKRPNVLFCKDIAE